MSCKTESLEIGDNLYSVTQWPAEKAMLVKFKLIKMFGSALALLIDENNVDFSNVITTLFQTSSPEELVSMIKSCVVGVACNDTKITETTFTSIFSGDKLSEMYKVFVFVIRTNYADFFKGQFGGELMTKMTGNL